MTDIEIVNELARGIDKVIATNGSSISVRNDNGVFLFVNEAWLQDFKVSPIGKTLAETGLFSAEEVVASDTIDREVKQHGAIVEVVRVRVNQQNLKLLLVKVYLKYQSEKYLVIVSVPLANSYETPTPFGWSADRASRVMGENIANRLQMLDEVFSVGLDKAASDMQALVETLRKALKEAEEK